MSRPLPKRLEDELSEIPRYKPEKFCIESFLEDSKESAIFDDIFGPKRTVPTAPKNSVSQTQFTTVLSSRLVEAEKSNKDMRRQLAHSNKRILDLEEENMQLNELLQNSSHDAHLLRKIKAENAKLHKQLMEMEKFLSDYGLMWVGNDAESPVPPAAEMDYDVFVNKVAELNELVLSEPAQVVTETDGGLRRARLAHPEEMLENINITMYKNGLMIKRGPFRPCGSESYNSFVGDILDGYFPSEFRSSCPQGVLLKLLDRRNDCYTEGSEEGQEVMKGPHFLNRLPKTVVRDGNIVSVRNDVAKLMEGGAPSTTEKTVTKDKTASGKRVSHVPSEAQECIEAGSELIDDLASVQVKWPNGVDVFIVKMYASDLVEDLRRILLSHVQAHPLPHEREDPESLASFYIRGSHPPRELGDELSLRQAGLVPNGTVHIRMI